MSNFDINNYPKDYREFATNVREELKVIESSKIGSKFDDEVTLEGWLVFWYNHDVLPWYKGVELDKVWGSGSSRDSHLNNYMLLHSFRRVVGEILQNTDVTSDELAHILVGKNINYGNSFDNVVDEFGIVGLLIRFADKISRLTQLREGQDDLVGEAIEDTVLDIAGYAILSLVYFRTRYNPSQDSI